MVKVWREVAASEQRLELLSELRELGIGLNEVEEFNIGLELNYRSERMKNQCKAAERKVVKVAMDIKIRDEKYMKFELHKKRNLKKRELQKLHKKNSRPYRRIVRFLQNEASKEKKVNSEKYKNKVIHLRNKYKVEEEEKINEVPKGLEEFENLSIFKQEEYDNIKCDEIKVTIVGDVNLDDDENKAMKLPPKFSMMQRLEKNGLAYEQEACYAKLRMEMRAVKEREEAQQTAHEHRKGTENGMSEESELIEKEVEEDARSRAVYDPIEKVFDPRKRRVTDLDTCDRVTLPKPLSVVEEAQIEMRRSLHSNVYDEYRKEFCDKNGDQKPNITEEESKGIKKIQKRINEKEIVYMKTDKSGKGCIATLEKYKDLGKEHVEKDIEIDRKEMRDIDNILNGHSRAWDKMWHTGEAHNQEGRVKSSNTGHSENEADLYMAFKDHKKKEKARPIATGCKSNTRALSNSVSDFVESVANNEERKIEVISSEDMLNSIENGNKKADEIHERWMQARMNKMRCSKCCIQYLRCQKHKVETLARDGGGGTGQPRHPPR